MLMSILRSHTGLEGMALQWFLSYMSACTRRVKIGSDVSSEVPLHHGVPQGSVLGPVIYSVYTQPLQEIVKWHDIWYHKYADDTTLYTIYDPAVTGDLEAARDHFIMCFKEVRT